MTDLKSLLPRERAEILLPAFLLLITFGVCLRVYFFVGFGLGDDLGYLGHAKTIISGHYPPLVASNQYAFRPLLLLVMAASIWLFGSNDIGLVAPFFIAGLVQIWVTYKLVTLFKGPSDHRTALVATFLICIYSFDVVGGSTVHNDILMSAFFHSGVYFLLSYSLGSAKKPFEAQLLGGTLLCCAILVKLTALVALLVFAVFLLGMMASKRVVKIPFLTCGILGAFFLAMAAFSFLKTGEPLWWFTAENSYYAQLIKTDPIYKPDMDRQWMYYLNNMFLKNGFAEWKYLEHAFFYYLSIPAILLTLFRYRRRPTLWPVFLIVSWLLFLHFAPFQISPFYIPIVRQSRYLELLSVPLAIIIGIGISDTIKRNGILVLFLSALFLFSFHESKQRAFELTDGTRDARLLAKAIEDGELPRDKMFCVDTPLANTAAFYMKDSYDSIFKVVQVDSWGSLNSLDTGCYPVTGGSRPSWWDPSLALKGRLLGDRYKLIREFPGRMTPWRGEPMRVWEEYR